MKYPIIFVSGVALRWEFFKSLKNFLKKDNSSGIGFSTPAALVRIKGWRGGGGAVSLNLLHRIINYISKLKLTLIIKHVFVKKTSSFPITERH